MTVYVCTYTSFLFLCCLTKALAGGVGRSVNLERAQQSTWFQHTKCHHQKHHETGAKRRQHGSLPAIFFNGYA